MGEESESAAIVRALIGLGHGLGVKIIAEPLEISAPLIKSAQRQIEYCDFSAAQLIIATRGADPRKEGRPDGHGQHQPQHDRHGSLHFRFRNKRVAPPLATSQRFIRRASAAYSSTYSKCSFQLRRNRHRIAGLLILFPRCGKVATSVLA